MSADVSSALSVAASMTPTGLIAIPVASPAAAAAAATVAASTSTATPGIAIGPAVAGPFTPAQIRHAYGVDQLSLDGTGQTIAIIDAYDDPTIATDLASFDSTFGLPAANLAKVYTSGSKAVSTPPATNSGWDLEISLDVEWAHAIAPGAKILLVEAASASTTDLFGAVNYAVSQGVSQVSMSFGGTEYGGDSSLDAYFNHPGVSFFASAGDSGAAVEFPAVSPYVTGVGGTTVSLDSAGDKLSETAWSGSGGGTSTTEPEPSYQVGFQSSNSRDVPDVSYDADPNSGIYVYYNGGYYQVGGTSAGSPQWAGLAALVNQGRASNGQAPIGTGLAYGLNSALYALAGGASYTNPNGDFTDITSGSNGNSATVGYDTVTGLGSPVANKLIPDLVAYGTTTTPTPTPTAPTIGDAGFETVAQGTGSMAYTYDPTGSSWTFTGSAGVSGNGTNFTNGNPNAPQDSQVAFLQQTGMISQTLTNFAAGTYQINLQAAERQNVASNQSIQVLVDGTVVGTISPSGTAYSTYVSPSFTVTAGNHTIALRGTSTSGDNTSFLDNVGIAQVPKPNTPIIGDSSFEAINVGSGSAAYAYDPTGSSWTFAGSAGVSGNNSAFTAGNPTAPLGGQVAFLQQTGSATQSIANWAAGTYTFSFLAAQRQNVASNQSIQVLVDGNVVGTITPTGTTYNVYYTSSFTVAAGNHTVSFQGTNSSGDNTAFIDSIRLNTASTAPTPGDQGFEAVSVGSGSAAYEYDPTGSSWTFAGSAGVSGNGSAFSAGNPNAPQGSQVAFLQQTGSITQSVAGWAAGKYTLSVSAAQRQNVASNQTIQVLIDGVLVASITPSGTNYAIYTTPSFTVAAGSHTITLQGTSSANDYTAFVDNVTINQATS